MRKERIFPAMSETHDPEENSAGMTARVHRTVRMLAVALERRRQKIAAGLPVDPPPQCHCAQCRDEALDQGPGLSRVDHSNLDESYGPTESLQPPSRYGM
jgi:hypothetical protein